MQHLFIPLFLFLTITAAQADGPLWPQKIGRIYVVTTNRNLSSPTSYNSSQMNETAADLAQLHRRPVTEVSIQYMNMTAGHLVLGPAEFGTSFDFPEPSGEIANFQELNKAGPLSLNLFKGPGWIHLLKPIDNEEQACLWIARKNNVMSGCGDVWQDGLTEDEVVCIGEKTYLRCHIDCMKKIYRRDGEIGERPGFCPEVTP